MRRYNVKSKEQVPTFPLDQAFAAAAAAFRINENNYYKADTRYDSTGTRPNREIMVDILDGKIQTTPEDTDTAAKIIKYLRGFAFKMLVKPLGEYESEMLRIVNGETVTPYKFGYVASAPSTWFKANRRQTADDKVRDSEPGYLGVIGQKITVKAEVLKCIYSQNWNTYYITALTDCNHLVFFPSKVELDTGGSMLTITGKVKAHREGFQTALNYVKVVD